jgi:methylenetetrahydrofolate reductase (NADPH)
MHISELFAAGDGPVFSFEFYPPPTPEGEALLFGALDVLKTLSPAFISVTWGAGGSTRDKTIDLVTRIHAQYGLETMAHFTCVNATVEQLHHALREMKERGIENVLALRGDPPQGQEKFERIDGGLGYGPELTALVAAGYDFCVAGACYPEVHQEAVSAEADLAHAKEKVDAGASVLITQLFYDNAAYFRFVEQARAAGIEVPIVPGLMPVSNVAQIKRIAKLCGAYFPPDFVAALEERADSPDAVIQLGIAQATAQASELLAGGAPGIHFYTLNRAPSTTAVLTALKLHKPWLRANPRQVSLTD